MIWKLCHISEVDRVAPAGGGPPGEPPGPPGYTMWPYAGTTFTKGGRAPGEYTMNWPGEPAAMECTSRQFNSPASGAVVAQVKACTSVCACVLLPESNFSANDSVAAVQPCHRRCNNTAHSLVHVHSA
jgi:hypothetical protein